MFRPRLPIPVCTLKDLCETTGYGIDKIDEMRAAGIVPEPHGTIGRSLVWLTDAMEAALPAILDYGSKGAERTAAAREAYWAERRKAREVKPYEPSAAVKWQLEQQKMFRANEQANKERSEYEAKHNSSTAFTPFAAGSK